MDRRTIEQTEALIWTKMGLRYLVTKSYEQPEEEKGAWLLAKNLAESFQGQSKDMCNFFHCEKVAEYCCGKCDTKYCSLACQKLDWSEHKPICGKNRDEICSSLAKDYVDDLNSPDPETKKTATNLVLFRGKFVKVEILAEDMIDYNKFIKAIKTKIPAFHEINDNGWQYWKSVRVGALEHLLARAKQ